MRVYSLRFEEFVSEWCWDGLRVWLHCYTYIAECGMSVMWRCHKKHTSRDMWPQVCHQPSFNIVLMTSVYILSACWKHLDKLIGNDNLSVCEPHFVGTMMFTASLHHCTGPDSGLLSNESILIRAGVGVIRHQDDYHKNWSSGTSWNIRERWES